MKNKKGSLEKESLMKETPYSEITATLEMLDRFGLGREDLTKIRADEVYAEELSWLMKIATKVGFEQALKMALWANNKEVDNKSILLLLTDMGWVVEENTEGGSHKIKINAKRVIGGDSYYISIIAGKFDYCEPQDNSGKYSRLEIGIRRNGGFVRYYGFILLSELTKVVADPLYAPSKK